MNPVPRFRLFRFGLCACPAALIGPVERHRPHGLWIEGGFGDDTIVGGSGAATFKFDDGLRGDAVIVNFRRLASVSATRSPVVAEFGRLHLHLARG